MLYILVIELFVPFLSLEKKVRRNFKMWAVSGEFRGCLSPAVQILSPPLKKVVYPEI